MTALSTSRPTTIEEALRYVDEVPETHFSKQDKTTVTGLLVMADDGLLHKCFSGDDPPMWLQRLKCLAEAAGPCHRCLFVNTQSNEQYVLLSDLEGFFSYSGLSRIAGCGWINAKCIILGEPEITRVYPSADGRVILDPSVLGRRGSSSTTALRIKGISRFDGVGLGKLAHWDASPYGVEAGLNLKKMN